MIQQEMEMDPDIPLRVDLFNSSGTSCIIEVVERCGSFFFLYGILSLAVHIIAKTIKIRSE